MFNFVTNIVVLDYLTNVDKKSPEIEANAKKLIESGYQSQLNFRLNDGSFSAWGQKDGKGSTWLTAFVAKSFNQASDYINIDKNKITEALNFLAKTQTNDGSFPEIGRIIHRDRQGGSSNGIALTSYAVIAFLEADKTKEKYRDVIDKAVNNIVNNFNQIGDNYSLAIATYAVALAKHDKLSAFIDKLNSKAVVDNNMRHWQKEGTPKNGAPNSINIEMTAYALLAFIEASREDEAVEIMKWLVTQQNQNGGFQSTQDTIVGLQALAECASKHLSTKNDIDIVVKTGGKQVSAINVNSQEKVKVRKREFKSSARNFEIQASGKGTSVFQISYRYNVDKSVDNHRFTLKPMIVGTTNTELFHLKVCTSFKADAQTKKSNMAVMEVSLPSGFKFDSDHRKALLETQNVKVSY